MDRPRLHAVAGRVDPGQRLAGRPLRHQAGVPHRARALRRRVDAVRRRPSRSASWSAFRVLQGVGGGMLTPIGIAMLFRAFPPIERARAATIVMVPTLVAPALGPVLGGLITDTIGWRWIFFVNVPFGIAALVFGLRFLREHTEPARRPLRRPGLRPVGLRAGGDRLRPQRGPARRLGRPGRRRARASAGSSPSPLLVWVETHQPAADARPPPAPATGCSPPPTSSWRSGWPASSA